jgi:uncharacterized protein (TIGR03546 family)
MIGFRKVRKIMALLRGQVSPVMAGISVGLGFWFGLMPGFYGLHAVLLVLLVLLNLPIGLFILSSVVLGKAASLAGAPVLHKLGLRVIEQVPELIDLVSSIPIVGVTDFSHTALSGALVAGPVSGALLGLLFGTMVLGFRKTWLKLEKNSEKFNTWQEKKWVRVMDRIVLGKRAKDAQATLVFKTKFIRKGGIVLAALLILVFGMGSFFFKGKIKDKAAATLSQTNGATVDIADLTLSPTSGRLSVVGLNIADQNNLNNNKIQIGEISTQASVYQMSVGKLVMDQVKISSVQFDQPRPSPAQRFAKTTAEQDAASETFDPNQYEIDANDIDKLENYFAKAKEIKAWIEKVRPWLPKGEGTAPSPIQEPLKYLDYLKTYIDTMPSVRVLAKQVLMEKVQLQSAQFGTSDIQLKNVSDAPLAAKLPVELEIKSEQGPHLNMAMHFEDPDQPGKVTGSFADFDLAKLQSGLNQANALNLQSGRASGKVAGFLNRDLVDLTVHAQLSDLQATTQGKGLFGLDAKTTAQAFEAIKDLDVTLRIVGPITAPRLAFDTKGLKDALQTQLVAAGKQRAADELNKVIEKNLDSDKIPGELKDVINKDTISEGLKGLFGGKKK